MMGPRGNRRAPVQACRLHLVLTRVLLLRRRQGQRPVHPGQAMPQEGIPNRNGRLRAVAGGAWSDAIALVAGRLKAVAVPTNEQRTETEVVFYRLKRRLLLLFIAIAESTMLFRHCFD